ncbi:hypothetical protein L6164_000832 [Bauhinia variegata]|uniref:Uncharacterized protein n=1 Tax=Bauhinia variegata TaxID=167791 RepID=A0ACB9Q7B0_BAUVA|nr:hypothetical protein L6164_000832 [Bauhinia variegata]
MEDLSLLLLISFFSATILFFIFIFGSQTSKSAKHPPGPHPFPIIGNILELIGSMPHQALANLSKIYGPIMTLKLGSKTTIVISSPEVAKEVLQKNDQAFSSRTVLDTLRVFDHHKVSVVSLPSSALWRILRKACATKVFSPQQLDATEIIRRRKVEELLNFVDECCRKGEALDVAEAALTTVLNSISNTFFSMDFAHYSSDKLKEFKQIIRGSMEEAGRPNFVDFFPIFRVLGPLARVRLNKYVGKLIEIFDGLIEERLRLWDSKMESEVCKDVLDLFLELMMQEDSQLNRVHIIHLFLDLFIAGIDTTSSTVEWAMAELLRSPEKLAKARKELQQVLLEVIHASGVAPLSRELRENSTTSVTSPEFNKLFLELLDKHLVSSTPPLYSGDNCFTYSHILKAVQSLSSRLHSILSGAYDPDLIRRKPQDIDDLDSKERSAVQTFKSSESVVTMVDSSKEYTPKIVGIYMPPSVEYIVAALSVLRCGEAFLPLDPFWPNERILSVVPSSNVDLIIASQSSFGRINSDQLDESHWLVKSSVCPVLNFSMEENFQDNTCPTGLAWPCELERPRSFCYLMYTSGSTGKPKGVCGTEQGLSNRFLWMQGMYPLDGLEILLFKTSVSFVDHLQEFLSAILTASVLVIPPFSELKQNIFSFIDFLQAYLINRLTAVPSLMRTVLPQLQTHADVRIRSSLKVIVLSGEILPLNLWEMLSTILPETSILNLYGSTEVSGDCTYFDCKRMPLILKSEILTSVPIGLPISNCDVVLIGENGASNEGELYVGGSCISRGYYSESKLMCDNDFVKFPGTYNCRGSVNACQSHLYFRTGDLAKQLPTGDFIFLGRKDRIVKVHGHRIALEEIEDLLREYPDINDVAVICRNSKEDLAVLEAFIILKDVERPESFPLSPSGKVNYELLAGSTSFTKLIKDKIGDIGCVNLLQLIRKAFHDALVVEEVSNDDDFFQMGGNSLAAAHVALNLEIDMKFLYYFPTPYKLCMALLQKRGSCSLHNRLDVCSEIITDRQSDLFSFNLYDSAYPQLHEPKVISESSGDYSFPSKRLKSNSTTDAPSGGDGYFPWYSSSMFLSCSFSRCNKVLYKWQSGGIDMHQTIWSNAKVPRDRRGHMKDLWKVYMESCVDASATIVFEGSDIFLFIGSHSSKFLCINARSGSIQWEIKLEGRVECTAAIVGDFSQVVVGCYKGKIYFLDFSNGNICWSFQTSGEVKSQPVVDTCRRLIWCGSHDHNLYALDYKNHHCVYKLPCGGSIYGSPAIDQVRNVLYVASTSGRLTAISLGVCPFNILWLHELEVPVFGSLSVTLKGTVICCLVDGHVLALDPMGSIIWKKTTDGPIFAGPSVSSALPSEVLVCSRNGSVYSFKLENGDVIWEYNVGDPITASAYVDEHLQLEHDSSDRLICICSSSGGLYLLRVNSNVNEDVTSVQEFARLTLPGPIFSSPLMIGGRIFVGSRDDYLHCIDLQKLAPSS